MKKFLMFVAILCAFEIASQVVHSQVNSEFDGLPFSAARQAGGMLFVSGQIPIRDDGSVITDSIDAATRQTMANIGAVLRQHGYTFDDVVNVTVYLSDMAHYDAMNAAYISYFDGELPARACVGRNQIVFDAPMEISCIAYKASP